jgi:hypothetical protein
MEFVLQKNFAGSEKKFSVECFREALLNERTGTSVNPTRFFQKNSHFLRGNRAASLFRGGSSFATTTRARGDARKPRAEQKERGRLRN